MGSIGRRLRPSETDVLVLISIVFLFGPLSIALIDAYEFRVYQVLSGLLVPFVLLVLFALFRYPGWYRL